MFGSTMLEVAIGVIFVFILVSIICTAIREGIEGWLKTRAAYLEHGIRQLLSDNQGDGLAKELYNHPLIFGLFNNAYKPGNSSGSPALFAKGNNLPSYIPSKNFALALMDIAARGPVTDNANSDASTLVVTLNTLRKNVVNLGSPFVQRLLLTAIDTAQGDLNRAQAYIEDWYNSGMDRVSGWYKRSTQRILFSLALIASIALNINTITIASYLSTNQTARELLVKKAEVMDKAGSLPADQSYKSTSDELNTLGLPIGWNQTRFEAKNIPSIFFAGIVGWLLTAFAASLGAPFWFDTLNKVMVIRSTVKPHEKSQEESSEDRQIPGDNIPRAVPQVQAIAAVPVLSTPAVQPITAVPSANGHAEEPAAAVPSANGQAEEPGAAVPNAPEQPTIANANVSADDAEADIDGCDVEVMDKTNDEDLPITQGGVA